MKYYLEHDDRIISSCYLLRRGVALVRCDRNNYNNYKSYNFVAKCWQTTSVRFEGLEPITKEEANKYILARKLCK